MFLIVPTFEADFGEIEWWAGTDEEDVFGRIVDTKGVDDVRVYVGIDDLEEFDGYATDLWTRWSGIPINGYVVLSRDLLNTASDQYIIAVMVHELGHVLGFGTLSWYDMLENHSRDREGQETYFSGTEAHHAFDEAGGRRYRHNWVPVQNRGGGRGAHWRESILGSEIMTYGGDENEPLSAITIQALADLGYEVDPSRAEPYQVPAAAKVVAGEPRWRCGVGRIRGGQIHPPPPWPGIERLKPRRGNDLNRGA